MLRQATLLRTLCVVVGGFVAIWAPAPCTAQDQYFDAGGVRLHYVEQGKGAPVVLVHGFGNRLEIWTTTGIAPALARDHRVITFDLRGHGRSDKPHDPARYGHEMALDIVRLLDHLGIARAHIVGYSLGAHLTSELLTLHPERFSSATLIAGYGRFDWSTAAARQADTVANELEQHCISRTLMVRLSSPSGRPTEDSLRHVEARCFADSTTDRMALAAAFRSWGDQAMTEAATSAVKVPTLAIVGSEDPMRYGLEELVRLRPSVKLVVVEGATHAGRSGILQRPETIAALRGFLAAHHEGS
jgi:pimeloyl-ACP methyl ester carboxylesterase